MMNTRLHPPGFKRFFIRFISYDEVTLSSKTESDMTINLITCDYK